MATRGPKSNHKSYSWPKSLLDQSCMIRKDQDPIFMSHDAQTPKIQAYGTNNEQILLSS